ncbi:MAG: hypothetical protein ACRDRF_00730 [Pseudonocardiaceae bacterium]
MAGEKDSKIERGGRAIKTEDGVGRVRIYVSMTDSKTKKSVPENITDTLYVKGSKVSDVAKQITKAFGG